MVGFEISIHDKTSSVQETKDSLVMLMRKRTKIQGLDPPIRVLFPIGMQIDTILWTGWAEEGKVSRSRLLFINPHKSKVVKSLYPSALTMNSAKLGNTRLRWPRTSQE
jgi:hypothetical protein